MPLLTPQGNVPLQDMQGMVPPNEQDLTAQSRQKAAMLMEILGREKSSLAEAPLEWPFGTPTHDEAFQDWYREYAAKQGIPQNLDQQRMYQSTAGAMRARAGLDTPLVQFNKPAGDSRARQGSAKSPSQPPQEKQQSKSFQQAFHDARLKGLREFTWKDKNYTTRMAGESVPKWKERLKTTAGGEPDKNSPMMVYDPHTGVTSQSVMNKPGVVYSDSVPTRQQWEQRVGDFNKELFDLMEKYYGKPDPADSASTWELMRPHPPAKQKM